MKKHPFLCAAAICSLVGFSQAAMVITEFSYQGLDALETEYVEFTNIGTTAVDMTGWGFNDSVTTDTPISLSAFGLVQPGQSVIVTDAATADDFRTLWNLDSSVVIVATGKGSTAGLGRGDVINLFDNNSALVDSLGYDDDIFDHPRARYISLVTDPENYGTGLTDGNAGDLWYQSALSDGLSFESTAGDIGSPGVAVIPEPSVAALGLLGALGMLRRRR